jgi:hypothetical protein
LQRGRDTAVLFGQEGAEVVTGQQRVGQPFLASSACPVVGRGLDQQTRPTAAVGPWFADDPRFAGETRGSLMTPAVRGSKPRGMGLWGIGFTGWISGLVVGRGLDQRTC